MIDNSSEPTIKLQIEQLQQLEVFQKRLANLESEVGIAQKTLLATKKDSERAVADRKYQEEQLATTTKAFEMAKTNLASLQSTHLATSATLDKINAEITDKTKVSLAKDKELADREAKVVAKESEIEALESQLSEKTKSFKNLQKIHDEKVAKLQAVINTI